MSNPISPARQHLYDLLASSAVLRDAGVTVYPEWTEEGTNYPICFLQIVDSRLRTPVGNDSIDAYPLIDIHIVFAPGTLLSVRDAIVDEIVKRGFIHRSRGSNIKGLITSCEIAYQRELPYRVLDSFYPRTIVGCKFLTNGN